VDKNINRRLWFNETEPFLAVTDLAVAFDIFSRKPRAGISDTIADEV
jgi:hypothetical protein